MFMRIFFVVKLRLKKLIKNGSIVYNGDKMNIFIAFEYFSCANCVICMHICAINAKKA